MAIAEGYKHNFNELLRAVSSGDAALLETTEKATGKPAIIMVAVTFAGKEYQMIPMARMFDANPYDELDPPSGSSERT